MLFECVRKLIFCVKYGLFINFNPNSWNFHHFFRIHCCQNPGTSKHAVIPYLSNPRSLLASSSYILWSWRLPLGCSSPELILPLFLLLTKSPGGKVSCSDSASIQGWNREGGKGDGGKKGMSYRGWKRMWPCALENNHFRFYFGHKLPQTQRFNNC